jgi:UDP-N-acetyl-D-galactosamine dehydrogenase
MKLNNLSDIKLAIIGLGYVGLPLAVEFSRRREVIGYDINSNRIHQLSQGIDNTLEISEDDLSSAHSLSFTNNVEDLLSCNCYIVTVPTPIDKHKNPDLTALINASEMIGRILGPGDIVIYESTVYPGATEEDCAPILERASGLKYISSSEHEQSSIPGEVIDGFFLGYSPERINPGDKSHRISSIKKVTSGSTPEIAEKIDELYREIITAGTHKAPSIRVAEAAKVIENTQRDLNIALINELSIIFKLMGLDTQAVLDAAGTKWNFLPFRPGLVGGHCIGVDPYYLTHKSKALGYHPEIILAGRRLNDSMGGHVVGQLVKAMIKRRIQVEASRILIMGFAFKENCPDMRNTRVMDIINELKDYNCYVEIYDPWVDREDAYLEYGVSLCEEPRNKYYDAIVLAVAHEQFVALGADGIRKLTKPDCVIYDLKYILSYEDSDLRL